MRLCNTVSERWLRQGNRREGCWALGFNTLQRQVLLPAVEGNAADCTDCKSAEVRLVS